MHVLLIGGVSRSLINFREPLIRALLNEGADVSVSAGDDDDFMDVKRHFSSMGVDAFPLPLKRAGMNAIGEINSILGLRDLIKRVSPDVVVAYTSKPVIYTGLSIIGGGKPKFIPMITGLGYAFSSDRSVKRVVINRLVKLLYRVSLSSAEVVIFQNEDDKELFRSSSLVRKTSDLQRVYGSGVDVVKFSPSPVPAEPSFLMMARLIKEKGVFQYVEAAKRVKKHHPSARFMLAGGLDDNPNSLTKSELDRYVAAGVVEYLGELRDVRDALRRCRFYVLPSYYREGVPRSTIEAMATGRPIITTDSTGCRDTVVDGKNGYLVSPRSVDSLTQAIENALRLSDDSVRQMGLYSREMVTSMFDAEVVNSRLIKIISNSSI